MYYGVRYYLPGLRRFISADTIVPGAANPQAFNRYTYTLNNPVRYSDPTGHRVADDPYWRARDQSRVPQPRNPVYGLPDPDLEPPAPLPNQPAPSGPSGGSSNANPAPPPTGVATPPADNSTVPALTSTQPAPGSGPGPQRPPSAPGTGWEKHKQPRLRIPPWIVPEYFTIAMGGEGFLGLNIAFTLDGWGQSYFTVAADGGTPGPIVEGMFGWHVSNKNLSAKELEQYLTGLGAAVTGGDVVGLGLYVSGTALSDTEGDKLDNAFVQVGGTTPGVNVSAGYTCRLTLDCIELFGSDIPSLLFGD